MFINILAKRPISCSHNTVKIRYFSCKSLDSFSVIKKPFDHVYQAISRRKNGKAAVRHVDDHKSEGATSLAHNDLNQQREIREYYRKIAWELPTLTKFSMKYQVPKKEDILKFRYTTYLGEKHPAESKVTMEVLLDSLGLSLVERHKLIVLSGPRYNPTTGVLKLSCELFADRDQNKKYLNQQLRRLIQETKNSRDTFEDIPQDLRHVKSKTCLTFPKEWVKS